MPSSGASQTVVLAPFKQKSEQLARLGRALRACLVSIVRASPNACTGGDLAEQNRNRGRRVRRRRDYRRDGPHGEQKALRGYESSFRG